MGYRLNIIGEFIDKNLERLFYENDVRKNLKFTRFMVVFSTLTYLIIGFFNYSRKDISVNIINFDMFLRFVIFAISLALFLSLGKTKNVKVISIHILSFSLLIYGSYLCMGFTFAPLQIMNQTFSLIIFSSVLFLLPNRWIVNVIFSAVFFVFYIITTPLVCVNSSHTERFIASFYASWNIIIISILFYCINVHKRKSLAKEIQLKELANTDHLTNIRNRQACDALLEQSCCTCTTFSYIMFDIDNFKTINDLYGHIVGDEILVTIVETAKKLIRKEDTLARWGGEEFAILMPNTTLDEASATAKRLKEQISFIKHKNVKMPITCSFGVTSFNEGDNSKSVTHRADQLLYLAKEYGKNRVVYG